MGVRGLTSYISNRSDYYLEYHQLCNTYVVIDGNSLTCQTYIWHTRANCAFGGDYDKYAQNVEKFYDRLQKCNVTPLVIYDGGFEKKKLRTLMLRAKDKSRVGCSYSPSSQANCKFMPLFLKDVFRIVTAEKGVRQVQCMFEADNTIAAVAKVLNCPVISYDSDFYIYGTSYIPFNTLGTTAVEKPSGGRYMIPCRIYKVENLFNSFKGLTQETLQLAAILLGNDYVQKGTFKYFFRHVKLQKNCRRKISRTQRRIEATFSWLSRHSLNDAVILILNRIPKPFRQKLLDTIEEHVNEYNTLPSEIFGRLGLMEEEHAHSLSNLKNQPFKFEGDINSLPDLEAAIMKDPHDSDLSDSDDEEEIDIPMVNTIEESTNPAEQLAYKLPQWFIDEFMTGNFPTYFMDLILHNLYVCPVVIEDLTLPATMHSCSKVLGTVYRLLVTGVHTKSHTVTYATRGDRPGIRYHKLIPETTWMSQEYPSLHNLHHVPMDVKEQILLHTLGITHKESYDQLPRNWKLFIGAIKYWVHQTQGKYHKLHCHFNSLLVCLLLYVLDYKIGTYRNFSRFKKKYDDLVTKLEEQRKITGTRKNLPTDITLAQACEEVDKADCFLVAPFFISHSGFDNKLKDNPKRFDRTIVHAFMEFQMCLAHIGHLNALLGYPYEKCNPAIMFNGTFLYNICVNLKSRRNVKAYMGTVLEKSPTLMRLFCLLLKVLAPLFPELVEATDDVQRSSCKRRREQRKD